MTSMFDDIRARLKKMDGAEIIVGVQGEPGTNFAGQNVSASENLQKIARVHEFGCDIDVTPKMRAWLHHNGIHLKAETTKIHIPERSYIRRAHADGKADFKTAFSDLVNLLFLGKITEEELMDKLGKQAMTDTYANMGDGTKPVTQLALQRRKTSPNPSPLIDTGDLKQHITYRIVKKGGAS